MATFSGLLSAAVEFTYEAQIYEKAEHWSFDTTVKAVDEKDAWAKLKKQYPTRGYRISGVRRVR